MLNSVVNLFLFSAVCGLMLTFVDNAEAGRRHRRRQGNNCGVQQPSCQPVCEPQSYCEPVVYHGGYMNDCCGGSSNYMHDSGYMNGCYPGTMYSYSQGDMPYPQQGGMYSQQNGMSYGDPRRGGVQSNMNSGDMRLGSPQNNAASSPSDTTGNRGSDAGGSGDSGNTDTGASDAATPNNQSAPPQPGGEGSSN